MVSICRNSRVHRFVALVLLLSFALREPAQAYSLSDAAFTVRMTTLIAEAKKYQKKKDEKGLIKVLFEIKSEVEGYTGQKISLSKMIDQVGKDLSKSGKPIPKAYLESYKKKLKECEKKAQKKGGWFCSVRAHQEDPFLYSYSKDGRKKTKEETSKVNVPARMSGGITMMLLATFLSRIPIPMCQKAATALGIYGAQEVYQAWVGEEEAKERKEKENAQ